LSAAALARSARFWNDDYELSILPVSPTSREVGTKVTFPLLSPYSWVCNNFAGEFQYGTFSIFVNRCRHSHLEVSADVSHNKAAALSITHLFVLAAGAFLLARDRRCLCSVVDLRRTRRPR